MANLNEDERPWRAEWIHAKQVDQLLALCRFQTSHLLTQYEETQVGS